MLANALVFILILVQSSSTPATRAESIAELTRQTNGECYGFEANPTDRDRFYCRWSFQPGEWFDAAADRTPDVPNPQPRWQVLVSVLTSTFMHAGWLHIIGNMVFLWVFGDNVEDRLGPVPYLLFYLGGGIVASLAQGFIDTASLVPTVGASGSVAAVLGAYLLWYPKATVKALVPLGFVLIPFNVPAFVMIGLWFAQNLLSGLITLGSARAGDGGVAFFAHIGGFIFGAAIALLLGAGGGNGRGRRRSGQRAVAGGRSDDGRWSTPWD